MPYYGTGGKVVRHARHVADQDFLCRRGRRLALLGSICLCFLDVLSVRVLPTSIGLFLFYGTLVRSCAWPSFVFLCRMITFMSKRWRLGQWLPSLYHNRAWRTPNPSLFSFLCLSFRDRQERNFRNSQPGSGGREKCPASQIALLNLLFLHRQSNRLYHLLKIPFRPPASELKAEAIR